MAVLTDDRKASQLLESEPSFPSTRDCWHCGFERDLCLTIVVAGKTRWKLEQPQEQGAGFSQLVPSQRSARARRLAGRG